MKEIICPNCHTTFQVDDSTFAAILSQVRNKEFNEEMERRLRDIQEQQKAKEEAVRLKAEKDFEARLFDKNQEISALKAQEIRIKSELEMINSRMEARVASLLASKDKELGSILIEKEKNISELKEEIARKEKETELKVLQAKDEGKSLLHEKERKVLELQALLEADRHSADNRISQLREMHTQQLKDKQEEIDRLKDFRLKLSTKMLGETLEQHCYIQFNQAKSYGQFPEATLEKDNTVSEGTKGDFIFRDYVDGEQYVSIMFEMKNEADATAAKHKNEHFFEKLHKDRLKKECEFAILVSMLEQGNELYDSGIVDVSYRYPKMLVIRPQFFLPVLRLISEGARKGYLRNRELLAELNAARNESRDFSKFEEKIAAFTKNFGKHVKGAHDKFVAATEGIDKIINNLERQINLLREVKANFEASEQRLLKADDFMEENLTVKKLTHGAPLIRKLIDEASRSEEADSPSD